MEILLKLDLEKNIDLCVKAAHQAEVEFRTGLGDVVAIAESIRHTIFPAIVIRNTPGCNGKVDCAQIKENFAICVSGLGRDTSKIISDGKWVELINSAAIGIHFNHVNLRSAIKVGRLFTEKSGLIDDNISEILNQMPLGTVSSVAHLGTSIIATSEDIDTLSISLEKFGEVRKY